MVVQADIDLHNRKAYWGNRANFDSDPVVEGRAAFATLLANWQTEREALEAERDRLREFVEATAFAWSQSATGAEETVLAIVSDKAAKLLAELQPPTDTAKTGGEEAGA